MILISNLADDLLASVLLHSFKLLYSLIAVFQLAGLLGPILQQLKRCLAFLISDLNLAVLELHQVLDRLNVHVVASNVQGCVTLFVEQVDHGFVLDQELDHRDVALTASVVQWGFAFAIAGVHFSEELNQGLDNIGVAGSYSFVQGHHIRVESVVDVGYESMELDFFV